jgi:hypothetical protein
MALKLFVDLDGVLVDFDSGVIKTTGAGPAGQNRRRMWAALAGTGAFYENLEWLPDGKALWKSILHLSPTILTGLPLGNWAKPQKLAWCARELGPEVPVVTCMSADKARVGRKLTPEGVVPVLIDDRESIEESWSSMGGFFILHRKTESSLEELFRFLSQ